MDWYVLQAFSGYENKVKLTLEDRIKRSGLQDFFEEILKDLENTFVNYKKSNNEKYLIEIKNITGNSIRDEQIVKLLAKTKDEFLDSIKKINSILNIG